MIQRTLHPILTKAAQEMPVVAVVGPRQSGKTTLCRAAFPHHAYVSLEPLDNREFATSDPRGFLRQYSGPAILDEAQRAPELFSYLQEAVDLDPSPGRFILTGSEHFGLSQQISQSLAGRVRLLSLLPLSAEELEGGGFEIADPWRCLCTGGYPRIRDRELSPDPWLADYTATYVQRDVRQVLQVTNLAAFSTFLRLTAARTGQELNLSTLGGDAGVSHNTARSWLSVLEAGFVLFQLPPWLRNLRKRAIKAPKLHFVDSGLACHLLGIREPEQLATHPLRGAIFESWVASEILKWRLHRGLSADLFHLRETRGFEVDLMVECARSILAVEVKSAETVASDFLDGLRGLRKRMKGSGEELDLHRRLVYGGNRAQSRTDAEIIPWNQVHHPGWE
ncbi:MAG: ATP-binding protein [Gemmatimonadales bacterium]|nr:MAG: ATP-binding protein [Gemmatimonadales bacterium]